MSKSQTQDDVVSSTSVKVQAKSPNSDQLKEILEVYRENKPSLPEIKDIPQKQKLVESIEEDFDPVDTGHFFVSRSARNIANFNQTMPVAQLLQSELATNSNTRSMRLTDLGTQNH